MASVNDTLVFADFDEVTGPPTVNGYTGIHDDFVNTSECVWVQLNGAGVNFNQSSVRRNMTFVHLSELDRPATISGVGYPAPASGSHSFVLMTFVRRLEIGKVRESAELSNLVLWLWIVQGYRRTGQTLTIDKQKFEVLDESPGAFGSMAHHDGQDTNDVFSHELTGGGIKYLGGAFHTLEVPHNGSVEIRTRIAAGPAGSFIAHEDPDKEKEKGKEADECHGYLAALICFLKRLFHLS